MLIANYNFLKYLKHSVKQATNLIINMQNLYEAKLQMLIRIIKCVRHYTSKILPYLLLTSNLLHAYYLPLRLIKMNKLAL